MPYTDTLSVARVSGLSLEQRDENVGTGDNSETDFDLDKYHIISSTYTLSYAASGSNSFTELTETTHYTLDKTSGRVVLTSAGVTALGTNILYATYRYVDQLSDADMDAFITSADAEVDELTGRSWGTAASVTEYISGRRNPFAPNNYPTTDEPYMSDWDAPDWIVLSNTPVSSITNVYFLKRNVSVSKLWGYDASGPTYTDNTTETNTAGGTAFYIWAATPATDDYIYVGSSYKFLGLKTILSTVGVGSTATWEYYNGTTWTEFTPTDTDSGASAFTASGKFTWSTPSGWAKTSVNSSGSLYFIRAKPAGSYTTSPLAFEIALDQDSTVDEEIEMYSVDYTEWGKLTFLSNRIPDGTRNIKVVYKQGKTTVPALVAELSSLLASIRAYAHITGASYDALTSYTLGGKSVTVGEQYVNVREVVRQFEVRINGGIEAGVKKTGLLDLIGRRQDIAVL